MELGPYVEASPSGGSAITPNVRVEIDMRPSTDEFGPELGKQLGQEVTQARAELFGRVAKVLIEHRESLAAEQKGLVSRRDELELDNAELIARNRAGVQLDELLKWQADQVATLSALDSEAVRLANAREQQSAHARIVEAELEKRERAGHPLTLAFETLPNDLDGLSFGFEEAIEEEVLEAISARFNKQERSTYIDSDSRTLDLRKAQSEPEAFLEALASGGQKLVKGVQPVAAATEALAATKAIRFFARLDGDRIGGFERSSMTPGKQALFALTLTLSESSEAWPLLIDQPEDDLDSRAIYDTIVSYLKKRKRERQVFMVSHNANLVVGADSEQVIVTNRHGSDRQNRQSRTFSYLAGSLEQSRPKRDTPFVLEICGIREHACEILDGGEKAFEKRRDKYKMY